MSSCLKKGSVPYAVWCNHSNCYFIQGFVPRCCGLGTPNRKYTCKYFGCEKCGKAFKTCKELIRHKAKSHAPRQKRGIYYVN